MGDRIVPRVQSTPDGFSLTDQSSKDRTDINLLPQRTMRMRLQGNPNGRTPIYGAMPSLSYHEMMNKIMALDTQFNRLPPKIRRRFKNQPLLLLGFLEDENNRREAVELGLVDDPELAEVIRQEKLDKIRAASNPSQLDLVKEAGERPFEGGEPDPEANPFKGIAKGGAKPATPK